MQTSLDEGLARTILDGGLRVVVEPMAEVRSVSLGVWVGVGARDEPGELAGASHFCEHLLFKGTETRSAREIAEAVDAVGGEMNAFTGREHTAYYLRVPARELDLALDVLGDILSRPAFRPDDVEAERHVILEELALNEDSPEDRVQSLLFEALFPDHPLGREVAGDRQTVSSAAAEELAGFHGERYRAPATAVAVAGAVDPDHVVARAGSVFTLPDGGAANGRTPPHAEPRSVAVLDRGTEQVHLALGWRAFGHHDDDRYPLAVLNQVLGGGTASRLFQEVREARGLVYSIYSAPSLFSDAGVLGVNAGTGPEQVDEVVDIVGTTVAGLLDEGPTGEELRVAKGCLEGSLVLGLEDSASRMARLGSEEITRGSVTPLDEHVARIRAVSHEDVARVTNRILGAAPTIAAVGPVEADALAAAIARGTFPVGH